MQRTTRWLCLCSALFFPACSDDGTGAEDSEDDGGMATTSTGGNEDDANPEGGSTSADDTQDDTLDDTSAGPSGDDTSDDDDSDTGNDDDNGDDSSSGETMGGLDPVDATIYEVQDGTIGEDDAVRITGAVITAVAPSGLFVQDPAGGEYSAVFVYPGDGGPDLVDYAVGDEVELVGVVDEFYDFTQVIIGSEGSLDIVDRGGAEAVPEPAAFDAEAFADQREAEPWEAVLVRVESEALVVTSVGVEGEEGVNEFTVAADDRVSFVVDDFVFDIVEDGEESFPDFGEEASFTAIVGPLNYSFEAYKIAPRSAADLEGYLAPPT